MEIAKGGVRKEVCKQTAKTTANQRGSKPSIGISGAKMGIKIKSIAIQCMKKP
ncbi:unnamed protein product, partial [marine sediment metagenome]